MNLIVSAHPIRMSTNILHKTRWEVSYADP